MLVAQGTQALHEGLGVDVEATLALNRLDDDGSDVTRLRVVLEDALDAGDGVVFADAMQLARSQGAEDATRHQAHAGGVRNDLAGQAQGHHGAAVVGTGEGDHTGAAGGGTGDLHGVFNGFGTGGDQQGFLREVARNALGDLFAQLDVRLVGQYLEAGVGQLGQLFLNGGNHFRVQVAGVQYCNAAREVDVLAAVNVPYGGVFGALGDDRVDLADATGDGSVTALQQGFVFTHGVLSWPLIGRPGSRMKTGEKTHGTAYDDRLSRHLRPAGWFVPVPPPENAGSGWLSALACHPRTHGKPSARREARQRYIRYRRGRGTSLRGNPRCRTSNLRGPGRKP
ncbi:hypothetical protein D3C78_625540 [compost metagenome]